MSLTQEAVDDLKVIDSDTHIIEPYDLWTSRVPSKYSDEVPHVIFNEKLQQDVWTTGGSLFRGSGGKDGYASATSSAMAGFNRYPPHRPRTLSEALPATVDANERLHLMDEQGIWAQVLYPNVGGFGGGSWTQIPDAELRLLCVQAYNDWLADFAAVAPDRFITNCSVPFWDIDESIKEIERARNIGSRGIVFSSHPQNYGQPHIADPHWDPLWALAQDLEMPINFHLGGGGVGDFDNVGYAGNSPSVNWAILASLIAMTNANAISEVIMSGLCDRFPRLNFVSVESGIGWIPFLLESMDWQWRNAGLPALQSTEVLPSEVFRRQWYGCFWFERGTVSSAIEALGDDHVLYETDFPHPVCMCPGPASVAITPRQYIAEVFSEMSEETTRKILHDNAAKLYKWE